jgi:XTP/dITP diphosphohydrolase
MTICFASNSQKKLLEIRALLKDNINLVSLADIGCTDELPENQDTLEGNSLEKALYVKANYGIDCFADDTGLEVDVLGGAPGVVSARYAGPQRSDEDNIALLLKNMQGNTQRSARFRTVITLLRGDEKIIFEGIVSGTILESPQGEGGFGYDPVFCPEGHTQSFAQMTLEQKNQLSHRGNAIKSLVEYLNSTKGKML